MKKFILKILILIILLIPTLSEANIPINTYEAEDVLDTTATISGAAGSGADVSYFRYSTMSKPPIFCNEIYGNNMKYTEDLAGGGIVYYYLKDLTPETTYYYCLMASNKDEIDGGPVRSFKTLPCQKCPPTIITKPAIVLTKISADLKGEYASSKAVTTYFEYKKDTEGAWTKTEEEAHLAKTYGKIHFLLEDLTPGTIYEFRAVARTEDPTETFYAKDILKFQTPKNNEIVNDIVDWTTVDSPINPTQTCGSSANSDAPVEDCNNNLCPPNWTGTYPDCEPPDPTCESLGLTGTHPLCEYPVLTCEELGMIGEPGECTFPPVPCAQLGMIGEPGECTFPPTTCALLGLTGEYPQCNYSGIDCEDMGMTGTYPQCNPIPPTCISLGMTGTYPQCEITPPTCVQLGMTGTYPQCTPTPPTCASLGMTGTYPSCTMTPPTCAQLGMNGTYPACTFTNNTGSNGGDLDGDDIPNIIDTDTDGDDIPNTTDTDDDGDGILDINDFTPTGIGTITDYSGNGIPNISDWDIDGDGMVNVLDTDIDGDGILNTTDTDDDNDGSIDIFDNSPKGIGNLNDYDGDGIANNFDSTPQGGIVRGTNTNTGIGNGSGNNGTTSNMGDVVVPPNDAIVRYHEGVETVFIRQIKRNTVLQQKYGHKEGADLQAFANYLAHFFGKNYGYVAKNRKEVRVRYADVAAYELREIGGATIVYESYLNKTTGNFEITGIRKLNSIFKLIFKYEYYFLKKR